MLLWSFIISKKMDPHYLSIWDYIIFGIVLGISAAIGIYFRFTGGKQKTIQEYLMADRQMSAIPVAFSLMASFISAITILGVSSEVYNYGTQFLLINLAYMVGTPIVCYVYLPVFYNLKIYSVYEYLERRFGKVTRLIASTVFLLQMILYMGIVLYAPSIALSAVTGLSKVGAILSVGIVCTFYSSLGGMKASLLMLAAVVCVIIQGIYEFGSVSQIWEIAQNGQRIDFWQFSIDPTHRHTFSHKLLEEHLCILAYQAQVQRIVSTRDLQTARLSLWYNLPIVMIISFSTGLAGLIIHAKYKDCDPILGKRIQSSDQLLPLFVVDSFKHIPGVTGLFIAGILSGSLSTCSSAINSLAAVTFEDYIGPLLKLEKRNLKTGTVSFIIKLIALVYGVICVALAFLSEHIAGVLQASLTIFGIAGGPLLSIFTLGMLFPSTSEKSVIPAFLCAIIVTSWIGFGRPKPVPLKLPLGKLCNVTFGNLSILSDEYSLSNSNNSWTTVESSEPAAPLEEYFYPYRISYQWYPLIGFTITMVLGLILAIFIRNENPVDRTLQSPIIIKGANVL
ncbi:putative sodium-dependent multivitamin transporter [Orchesella cincta]|uniref:Putative sodium-dependent multivitamin transporter n=1 Tax=Orchesella cincta TaxID=48709 RepID=A0A1D2MUA8_ORCCI|nr:putative sodium-dependent multivitamin transporter [Orchesella cincta]